MASRTWHATLRALSQCTVASVVFSTLALAEGRNPASLLLYPEFDHSAGRATFVTVTNTNPDPVVGRVLVELVLIDATTSATACLEQNQTELLTPNDTLTIRTNDIAPAFQRGYIYIFAKDQQGRAISYNWLIGDLVLADGFASLDYSVRPRGFASSRTMMQPTDVDMDGIRDLDGVEYEQAPDKIVVPRFLAPSALVDSSLVFVNLSGGREFTAILDFLLYNDNEEPFSAQHAFRCWRKSRLLEVNMAFSQAFLASTGDSANEILGQPAQESGWMEIDGRMAYSVNTSIDDPAILAFLVERTAAGAGAEESFEVGKQANGDLLPLGPAGDS